MSATENWRPLTAVQTCFVVPDLDAAVARCEAEFGWGPFLRFSAPSAGVAGGEGTTHVALGNAGRVQVELLALENVDDTIGAYQARYGRGFQHLGVFCRDIDAAREALDRIGGATRQTGDHPGIRFAFVDTPTGSGMIELLQPDANVPSPARPPRDHVSLAIDSATLVTADLGGALEFFARAFAWEDVEVIEDTLEIDGVAVGTARRAAASAGVLELEFIEPLTGDNLYSQHLAAREHGLVHVGARGPRNDACAVGSHGRWLADGTQFCWLETPFSQHGVRLGLADSA